MDIMTALAAVSQGLEALKTLRAIDKDFDASAYKLQVASLADSLATAKIGLVDAKEDIAAKDAEIARLKQAISFHGTLVEHNGLLYDRGEAGQPVGKPYCAACIVDDVKHVRLTYGEGMRGNASCPRCKASYRHVDFRPSPEPKSAS
jgi:hypothetical protein